MGHKCLDYSKQLDPRMGHSLQPRHLLATEQAAPCAGVAPTGAGAMRRHSLRWADAQAVRVASRGGAQLA